MVRRDHGWVLRQGAVKSGLTGTRLALEDVGADEEGAGLDGLEQSLLFHDVPSRNVDEDSAHLHGVEKGSVEEGPIGRRRRVDADNVALRRERRQRGHHLDTLRRLQDRSAIPRHHPHT